MSASSRRASPISGGARKQAPPPPSASPPPNPPPLLASVVLGRDGTDLERGHHLLSSSPSEQEFQSEHTNTNANANQSNWWSSLWTTAVGKSKSQDDDNHDDNDIDDGGASYTSMTDNDNDHINSDINHDTSDAFILKVPGLAQAGRNSPKRRPLISSSRVTTTPRRRGPLFSSVATKDDDDIISVTSNSSSLPAREEAVRQDCSFFYQDLEEQINNNNNEQNPASLLDYHAAEENPRYRAAYRARFQQLNEDTGLAFKHYNRNSIPHQHHHGNDLLFLEEDGNSTITTTTPAPNVLDVAQSTLCWTEQDGRILMKLPKDKIRLVMDSQMEPGILSVEYQSLPKKKNHPTQDDDDGDDDEQQEEAPESLPPLMYVLTVDENLYRRVVAEMSGAMVSPCSMHQFCMDEGRIDISVAIFLLSIVLIALLITTIIWPME